MNGGGGGGVGLFDGLGIDPSLYQNMLAQAQGINPLAGAQATYPYGPYPTPVTPAPGAAFRIEKIENGFLVHLAPSQLITPEVHYAADFKEVGELVTASLVRWFIDGK